MSLGMSQDDEKNLAPDCQICLQGHGCDGLCRQLREGVYWHWLSFIRQSALSDRVKKVESSRRVGVTFLSLLNFA